MSDMNSLRGKLSKLISESTRVENGWREITAGEGDLFATILDEIDETMFARCLTVQTEQGDSLCLEAGNRRLCRVVGPLPEALAGHAGVLDRALLDKDPKVLAAVATLLAAFCAGQERMFLQPDARGMDEASARAGISAQQLRKHGADGAAAPVDYAATVTAMQDVLQLHGGAWLRIVAGQARDMSGDEMRPEQIKMFCTTDWAARLGPDLTEPRFGCLGLAGPRLAETVVLAHGDEVFVACGVRLGPAELNALWRQSLTIG